MNKRGASAGMIFLPGVVGYADTYPLHKKLRQYEAMFNTAAHSGPPRNGGPRHWISPATWGNISSF